MPHISVAWLTRRKNTRDGGGAVLISWRVRVLLCIAELARKQSRHGCVIGSVGNGLIGRMGPLAAEILESFLISSVGRMGVEGLDCLRVRSTSRPSPEIRQSNGRTTL